MRRRRWRVWLRQEPALYGGARPAFVEWNRDRQREIPRPGNPEPSAEPAEPPPRLADHDDLPGPADLPDAAHDGWCADRRGASCPYWPAAWRGGAPDAGGSRPRAHSGSGAAHEAI